MFFLKKEFLIFLGYFFINFIICNPANVTINIGNETHFDQKSKYNFLDKFFNEDAQKLYKNKILISSFFFINFILLIKYLKNQINERFNFLEKNKLFLICDSIDDNLFSVIFENKEMIDKVFFSENSQKIDYQNLLHELIYLKKKIEEYSFSGVIVYFYDLFLPYNSPIKIFKNKEKLLKKIDFIINKIILILLI